MQDAFPMLQEDVLIPTISENTFLTIEEILQQTSGYKKYSHLFLEAVREGKVKSLRTKLDTFGVLCHGLLVQDNILFKYKKQLDSRLSCQDAIFRDLSHCHYGSCVMDLLQVIFASISIDVRQSFLADIVCSVYYDNFAKTVSSINKDISLFTKKQFIKEFDTNIMYGFLFSLQILSSTYLDDDTDIQQESDSRFRQHFLALVRDIVQFKVNAKATMS